MDNLEYWLISLDGNWASIGSVLDKLGQASGKSGENIGQVGINVGQIRDNKGLAIAIGNNYGQ